MVAAEILCRTDLQSRSEKRSIPSVPSLCGMARRRTLAESPRALRPFTRVCRRSVLICRVVATTLGRPRTTELQPSRWRNSLGGLGGHFCEFVPAVPDACDKDPTGAGRGFGCPKLAACPPASRRSTSSRLRLPDLDRFAEWHPTCSSGRKRQRR